MATSAWWKKLSYAEQVSYIEKHPNSKFELGSPKPLPEDAKKKIRPKLKSEKVKKELMKPVKAAEQKFKDTVAGTPEVQFGKRVMDIVNNKVEGGRTKAIKDFAIKAGLVLLASGTLTAITGTPVSFLAPTLVTMDWDSIPNLSEPAEMFQAFGQLFFDGLKIGVLENLFNTPDAAVNEKGDQNPSGEQAAVVKSNHETDLNKVLTNLENSKSLSEISTDTYVETAKVIDRTLYLEQNIPILGNIMVNARQQKKNLSVRANKQLTRFSNELLQLYQRSRALAQSTPNKSLQTVLKQHIGSPVDCFTIVSTDQNYTVAEYSGYEFDQNGRRLLVLAKPNDKSIDIAYSVDSTFIPRKFYTVSRRKLKSWLRDNVEV